MGSSDLPGQIPANQSFKNDDPVDCVPHLGPIRIRCLQKAGIHSIGDLRKMTADQLQLVRGITPIKAKEIVEMVGMPDNPTKEEPVTAETEAASDINKDEHIREKTRMLGKLAAELLHGDSASRLNADMSRQLARIIVMADDLAEGQFVVCKQEKVVNQIHRMLDMLQKCIHGQDWTTASQKRYVDELKKRRHKIKEWMSRV
jgi:hypothetical protein